ncbi:uncharacterized protein LOC130804775 [Amaranthus tricolor]|uniref:uncharacterized protein LOC130804775 n=1 Tax=Amaranthus tricolor TaxID=29722 RepID=UPI00258B8ED8|nr:uncharacterized protein LOC130804775 [Amaranthus tricolor]
MDIKNLDLSLISSTRKSSSWPIVSGSLDHVVTCESSFSAVDSDDSSRKHPLILRRPSLDSDPCEITIFFTQQHEIRQVYVRSTARVYEIYYEACEKGGNEYLCTVRCGVAARTEESLHETDDVGLPTSTSNSNGSSCEGHSRSESGGSTNEDGWVDVKVRNSSMLDARDSFLTKKDKSCMNRVNQDSFEATAEISDGAPVVSVTIRLLSIQSGEYINIDEIYVFADPVVSSDTNSLPNKPETSSDMATMSLLIPTLLQMSKNQRNQKQGQSDSSAVVNKCHNPEDKPIGMPMIASTSQSESTQEALLSSGSELMSQSELQRLDSQVKSFPSSDRSEFSCSRIERTLDELVSRVTKIEHFCLRFEETLVKPVSNMEARLERIEHQLDTFFKTAKSSMTECTRISAPNYICSESESDSIFTEGNDSPSTIQCKSIKKDQDSFEDMSNTPSDAYSSLCNQPNGVPSSTTASQLHPSLVLTAPDFSFVDDEGDNGPLETLKESPKSILKKPLSIDDCLASALAGFLSSASININMDEETADTYSKEETGKTSQSEVIKSDDQAVLFDVPDISGKYNVEIEEDSSVADNGFTETKFVDKNSLIYEGDNETHISTCNEVNVDQVKTVGDLSVDVRSIEAEDDSNQLFSFDSPVNDTNVTALRIPADCINSSSGIETANESAGILLNTLKLQSPFVVDFETPILDVTFLSQESSSKYSLDGLLVDDPELHSEVSYGKEYNATSFNQQSNLDNATPFNKQCDLVIIDNVDSATSETSTNFSFCLDYHDADCVPLNREEAEQNKCSTQDMGASLI